MSGSGDSEGARLYRSMRERALTMKASDIVPGIEAGDIPYSVLMETGYPNAVATLTAFQSGDASLYFSTGGGGMIGGIGHETVRNAAQIFVGIAKNFLPQLMPAKEFPLPATGRTKFYVLTGRGIFTAEFLENDLGNKQSDFWPFFYAGHGVITEFRLVTEKQQKR